MLHLTTTRLQLDECHNEEPIHLIISLTSTHAEIGWCKLEIINHLEQEAEISYELYPNYWNNGYMTEAAQSMIEFAFTQLNIHRIYGTCDPSNKASIRVMEKLGMRQEQDMYENKWYQGENTERLIFSILHREWIIKFNSLTSLDTARAQTHERP